jgi:hypothetical protein
MVVACGRRFGKTELGKLLVLEKAISSKHCWWVSPTYRMAAQVWRDLRRDVRRLKKEVVINQEEMRIDFAIGGSISIRSAHQPDNLRGAGLDLVVLDEAAYMMPDVWPEVIRPMLLERQGGALFISTPYGRNWFWEIYQLGLDPAQPDWRSYHYTSYDNPLIPKDEIDDIRRTTPERVFRAEYLAEFIDDEGQVFRGVSEAATAPLHAQPVFGRQYVAGIDWGRSNDYTVICILDAETHQLVTIDRFNRVGWELQRGRLKALCERWQPGTIWAEENSIGSVNIEALQAEGLPVRSFKMTATSKQPLIEALALAIERGEIALLPDETLLSELMAYEMQRIPGGGFRFSNPPGLHDDCVISLALAWHGVRYGGVGIDFA